MPFTLYSPTSCWKEFLFALNAFIRLFIRTCVRIISGRRPFCNSWAFYTTLFMSEMFFSVRRGVIRSSVIGIWAGWLQIALFVEEKWFAHLSLDAKEYLEQISMKSNAKQIHMVQRMISISFYFCSLPRKSLIIQYRLTVLSTAFPVRKAQPRFSKSNFSIFLSWNNVFRYMSSNNTGDFSFNIFEEIVLQNKTQPAGFGRLEGQLAWRDVYS